MTDSQNKLDAQQHDGWSSLNNSAKPASQSAEQTDQHASPAALPAQPESAFSPSSSPSIIDTATDTTQALAARLESLLEISSDGMSDWDLRTNSMYLSPRWLEIMDYPLNAVYPGNVTSLTERLHPDDAEFVTQALQSCLQGDQNRLEAEYRVVLGSGEVRWVHTRGLVKRDSAGVPLRFVCSLRDVTQRRLSGEKLRESEAQLRDSEKRYRMLVENTSDAIIALSKDLEVTYASASVAQVFGFHPEELMGFKIFAHVHADDVDRVRRLLRHGIRTHGHVPPILFRLLDKDGRLCWVEAKGNNMLNEPDVGAVVVSVRDITARALAEQQLRVSESLYRTVFESVSDGLRISDVNTDETLEVNAAWCKMHGYTREEAVKLKVADFVPSNGYVLFPTRWLETLRKGGSVRGQSINKRKDGSTFPVDIRAQNASSEGRPLALAVVRDITEQVQTMELLERRVEERTSELSNLLEATRVLSSTLDLQALLQLIVDQIGLVVQHRSINLHLVESKDQMHLVAHRGIQAYESIEAITFWKPTLLDRMVLESGEPMLIPDVNVQTWEAQQWQLSMQERFGSIQSSVKSWINVPLVTRDEVVGLVALDHAEPNYFTSVHVELVRAFATQAAAVISNARLYEAEQRRLRESERRRAVAEGLRDILRVLNSAQPLEEILGYILSRSEELLGSRFSAIYKLDPVAQILRVQVAQNLPIQFTRNATTVVGKGAVGRAVQTHKPYTTQNLAALIQQDYAGDTERLQLLAPLTEAYRGALAVPLMIKDECYGALLLLYPDAREFSDESIELASAIGDQAALAIENARLRSDAARVGAVAERSRLARELHDSVSQALYGIALGARTARELIDTSPTRAIEPLNYVLSLVQGGLAEMRALIFELRPESLATEGLVAAFTKQAEALCVRHGINVTFEQTVEPQITLDAKEALYRIALEAIQNTIKHARATEVILRLHTLVDPTGQKYASMEIEDNGCGFDPTQNFPGHIGLQSMRERAESLGGTLRVVSQASQGTVIIASVPISPTALSMNGQ